MPKTLSNEDLVKNPSLLDLSPEWLEFSQTVQALMLRKYYGAGLQRRGQATFNALCDVRPDLAEEARGSLWDPFYRDDVLPEFWNKIYNHFILTLDD